MHLRIHAAASLVALLLPAVAAGTPITLEQATALADRHNVSLARAHAALAAVEGELDDARAPLRNNPEVLAESRRRSLTGGASTTRYDAALGLSQRFELGGQQEARRRSAQSDQRAAALAIEDLRREVRAETARRFFVLLGLQLREQIEERSLELLRSAAALTGRRVAAGEDSRLDGNLAAVEAERGANQVARTREERVQALTALSAHLQLEPGIEVEAAGDLDEPELRYTLEELLAVAARRPGLRALASKEQSAQSRLELERANRVPDLTVGLLYGPERSVDATDRVATLSFSLPLPLFNRNSGGIGRALAELDQARIQRASAERDARAAVRALWERLRSLQQRNERLGTRVLPSLEENQQLSLRALRAGEISMPQFLVVRRQALDGQLDVLDARTQLRLVRAALERAAGLPEVLPPPEGGRSGP